MRKRIVGPHRTEAGSESEQNWIDLEQIATVKLTSEHPSFELNRHCVRGLRRLAIIGQNLRLARFSEGAQQIRTIFDEPVSLHRIHLRFHEAEWRANALKFGVLDYALAACSFAAAGGIVEQPDISL